MHWYDGAVKESLAKMNSKNVVHLTVRNMDGACGRDEIGHSRDFMDLGLLGRCLTT